MRTLVRAGAVVLWACLVGTAAGTYGIAEAAGSTHPRAQSGCIEINGVLHCPCEESREACLPPECVLLPEGWYCPENR